MASTPEQVDLQAIGYTQVASLTEKRVDAAVSYAMNEPVQLAQSGYGTHVFNLDEYTRLVSNGLVTSDTIVASDADLVQAVVDGLVQGVSATLEDPDAAFAITRKYIPEMDDASAVLQRAVLDACLRYWETDRLGYNDPGDWEASVAAAKNPGTAQYRCADRRPVHEPVHRAMSSAPILTAENLQVVFESEDSRLEALQEASFQIQPKEFVCIIGPSGCGKSTLLRVLGGLVSPTRGRVCLEDRPLTGPQRRIGFVFQQHNLMPWRTALDNICLPLELQHVPRPRARAMARDMLSLVDLDAFADLYPRELSGGMRQRVALARELVYDPDVLLLDEPFGALDALTREQMDWELLRIWSARQKTVVMVTHNIQEAIYLSDRVLTMSSRPGRIETQVTIDLPRPRSVEDLYAPRFVELTRMLRASLH